MSKISFLAGFGVGYVLGTRAGHDRYDAIRHRVRTVKERPEVQEVAGVVTAQAGLLVGRVRSAVLSRAGRGSVDLTEPEPYGEAFPGPGRNGLGSH